MEFAVFYLPLWTLEWGLTFPTYTGSFMMVQPEVWISTSKRVEEEDEMDAFVKLFYIPFQAQLKGR